MKSPEVFYTYEWALATSQAYAASLNPHLLLAYEGDVLVGVAALATNIEQTEAFFLSGMTADYCDFVSHPADRTAFIRLAMMALESICPFALRMASVPAFSPTTHAMRQVCMEHGCTSFVRSAYQCPQVEFSSPQAREFIQHQTRSKQMIRRHLKSMARLGPVKFSHLTTWSEVAKELPAFRDAHVRRFQTLGRTSNLTEPRRWSFLGKLARLLSAQGWMNLSVLSMGDRPVAWICGFNFGGSWFYYQPAFDPEFQRYYPGLCLLGRFIEDACDDPEIDRVDLGLGDEEYKSRFSTGYRETVDITVTKSAVRHVRERLRHQVATAIKSSPRLEHCVRWLLGRPAEGSLRA